MATPWISSNLRPLLELPTDAFRWLPDDRLYATEASRLYLAGKPATWFLQQLYRDDPLPQGIALRCHKTGDVWRFELIHREVKRQKLLNWVFQSLAEPKDTFVVIYNE